MQHDDFLSQAVELQKETLAGGPNAVYIFRELLMLLLSKTVLDSKSFLVVHSSSVPDSFVIAPHRRTDEQFFAAADGSEVYQSLKLRNGYFLDLRYSLFRDKEDDFLKIESSRMVYQSDDLGLDQFFRIEMARVPDNHYPQSHLHVNGNWKDGKAARPKDMERVHFPIARPTIESLIRLLVYDFEIGSHTAPEVFEPVLQACEKEFFNVARLTPKDAPPLPGSEK